MSESESESERGSCPHCVLTYMTDLYGRSYCRLSVLKLLRFIADGSHAKGRGIVLMQRCLVASTGVVSGKPIEWGDCQQMPDLMARQARRGLRESGLDWWFPEWLHQRLDKWL